MAAKWIGGFLIFVGLSMLALGGVNYLGYGLGLDGNTPIIAVGLMFLFLGWLKWGEKPKSEGDDGSSISDNASRPD